MTTGIQNISNPEVEIGSSTSQAGIASSTVSATLAATTEAGSKTGDTATTPKAVEKPVNPNKGVESKVREYFADLPIMAEVSKCESRYRQFAKDGSIFRGVVNNQDVGVMQVNEYYHAKRAKKLGYNLRTLEGNMAYARLLYEEEGVQPWSSSAPCWMKSDVAKAMFDKKILAEK